MCAMSWWRALWRRLFGRRPVSVPPPPRAAWRGRPAPGGIWWADGPDQEGNGSKGPPRLVLRTRRGGSARPQNPHQDPARRPPPPRPPPARGGHDRLLALPLHVHVGVDLGQGTLDEHLLDQYRNRVRQLVAYPLQGRLADQLPDEHLLGLVGEHVVRVQPGRLGQVAAQHLDERVQALPGDGTDRYHIGEVGQLADRDQLGGHIRPGDQVDLGDHGHDAGAEPGDLRGDEPVAAPDLLVGRDAQADHVDLAPRLPDEVVEPLPEQGTRPVQAGRVDEHELRVRPVQDSAYHVPRGLRLGRGDRDLLAD